MLQIAAYANYVETLPEFIAHHAMEKFRNPLAQSKLDALKRDSDIQRKPLKEKEAMDTQPSSSHDNLKWCQSQDLVLRRTEKNESASTAELKWLSTGHNEDKDWQILKLQGETDQASSHAVMGRIWSSNATYTTYFWSDIMSIIA